jgi:hypothetical protein
MRPCIKCTLSLPVEVAMAIRFLLLIELLQGYSFNWQKVYSFITLVYRIVQGGILKYFCHKIMLLMSLYA